MKQQSTHDRKTALVTGASSGIGLELSRLLAADGYDLILIARGIDSLNRVADELKAHHGVRVRVIPKDLSGPAAAEELVREIEDESVEILVNNAGVGLAGPFAEADTAKTEQMMQLNMVALTALTRRLLPGMLARGQGQILNVASLGGYQPGGPGMAVYYATKAYVLSFSQALAAELRGTGITVTALSPGPVNTDFEAKAGLQNTQLLRWLPPAEARTVARAAYRGMQRGRPVVIPGLLAKVLSIAGGLPPRSLALEVNRLLLSRS
jgi:short-subunit dehydrogenase